MSPSTAPPPPGAEGEDPQWFGPPGAALYGVVTLPERSRGVVVIAPPFGRESRASRFALRRLAADLAAAGFGSVRYDHPGTGDSSGSLDDPEVGRAWVGAVGAAVTFARDLGAGPVAAVGMRMGATVLGVAAAESDLGLDALILWDPCASGRRFLREVGALEALRREGAGPRGDGSVESTDFLLDVAAVRSLGGLDLARAVGRRLAARVLVLVREDRTPAPEVTRLAESEGAELRAVPGQGPLLDVEPLAARLPLAALATSVEWLTEGRPTVSEVSRPQRRLSHLVADGEVRESVVRVGRRGLVAIVDEPARQPVRGPLVLFLNTANGDHSGPARLWVTLSRAWAARGLRCARFDLSGVGDSPRVYGDRLHVFYEPEWIDDVTDAVSAISALDPSEVVYVGLCSGVPLALDAARRLGAREVVAVNPPVGTDAAVAIMRLGLSRWPACRGLSRAWARFAYRARWKNALVFNAARRLLPMLGPDVMAEVARRGVALTVYASREDLETPSRLPLLRSVDRHRIAAPRGYAVELVEDLDHSMHTEAARRAVVARLESRLADAWIDKRAEALGPGGHHDDE